MGDVEIVRDLLIYGIVDVNLPNEYGETAHLVASGRGYLETVRELLKEDLVDENAARTYS